MVYGHLDTRSHLLECFNISQPADVAILLTRTPGTDKLGHPVYYEKPGVVDPKELFKAVTTERVMQFHVQVFHPQTSCS
jgi:hypothetical protein